MCRWFYMCKLSISRVPSTESYIIEGVGELVIEANVMLQPRSKCRPESFVDYKQISGLRGKDEISNIDPRLIKTKKRDFVEEASTTAEDHLACILMISLLKSMRLCRGRLETDQMKNNDFAKEASATAENHLACILMISLLNLIRLYRGRFKLHFMELGESPQTPRDGDTGRNELCHYGKAFRKKDCFILEFCLAQYEDIVQLEWLSTFVEESFSGGSLTMSKDQVSNGNSKDSSQQFQTPSPVSVPRAATASCSADNKLGHAPPRDHQPDPAAGLAASGPDYRRSIPARRCNSSPSRPRAKL
ncbi:hypothetical protein NL676_030281 [Syzygium grande]|nr:hypothetical protein NL676_030281 [Syzygium grande]